MGGFGAQGPKAAHPRAQCPPAMMARMLRSRLQCGLAHWCEQQAACTTTDKQQAAGTPKTRPFHQAPLLPLPVCEPLPSTVPLQLPRAAGGSSACRCCCNCSSRSPMAAAGTSAGVPGADGWRLPMPPPPLPAPPHSSSRHMSVQQPPLSATGGTASFFCPLPVVAAALAGRLVCFTSMRSGLTSFDTSSRVSMISVNSGRLS